MAFPTKTISRELYQRQIIKEQIRHPMEAGYIKSRARFTHERQRFIIGWKNLPDTQYKDLEAHFAANVGGSFSWTNTEDSTAYTVTYAQNELPRAKLVNADEWRIAGIILEEP